MSADGLQAWVQQQVAAGLPALAGARVTATLPLQVALVNELIAEALADAGRPSSAPSSGDARPDMAALLRHVRSVRIDASPCVITLDVALAIDE
jgi:hypothetical protein